MKTIDKNKVLDVLNELEVVEEGAEGYILVENTSEVHEKLNALGVASETINKYGDEETFCIIALAFSEKYANEFVDGKLVMIPDLASVVEQLNAEVAEAADLHLEAILELQRIQLLLAPIENSNRLIGVALSELEAKFHKIHDKWCEN